VAPSAARSQCAKGDGHALPFKTDAVFTNAALHWMRRGKLVVAGVARALSLGRFVGEFGGHAWRRSSQGRPLSLDRRISAAAEQDGFVTKSIIFVPRPTALEIGIRGWLETFGRSFFEQLLGAGTVEDLGRSPRSVAPGPV
jgi:hypothetical protein